MILQFTVLFWLEHNIVYVSDINIKYISFWGKKCLVSYSECKISLLISTWRPKGKIIFLEVVSEWKAGKNWYRRLETLHYPTSIGCQLKQCQKCGVCIQTWKMWYCFLVYVVMKRALRGIFKIYLSDSFTEHFLHHENKTLTTSSVSNGVLIS